MQEIQEGFFSNKYEKYKKNVIFTLKKLYGIDISNLEKTVLHDIEYWIKDYFLDKMEERDCVMAIRDNFRRYCNESVLDEDAYMDAMDRELDDIQKEKVLENFFYKFCKKVDEGLGIKLKMLPDGKKKIDGEKVYFAADRQENYRGDLVYIIVKQVALDELELETSIKHNDKIIDHLSWYVYPDEPERWDEAIKDIKGAFTEYMTKKSLFKRVLNKITPDEFKTGRLKESVQLLENAGYIVEWSMDDANETFNLENFGEYLYTVREILVKRGFSRGKQADNYDELHDIAYSCCAKGFNPEECAKMIINKIK